MNPSSSLPRVGFIGLGIMGQHMAGHLLSHGHPLTVYTRSREKATGLVESGAVWADSPGAVSARSDVVISIVGYPSDVESVWLGPDGLIAHASPNALLIDMTTSSPALARRLADDAALAGCRALDAPVSGGDVGARGAKLSIMVGGDAQAFAAVLPILQCLGTNIVHVGPAGAGQHTKMSNQIVIASTIMGVCEGLAYAQKAGLDANVLLQAIGGGAAGSFQLNVLGPRIVKGDFVPGFLIEHFLKDLGIALDEAARMQLDLPGATLARRLYTELADRGSARQGTQALFQHYLAGA